MEILVYEDAEKDYQTVTDIDWKIFDKKVKERPEDYVFILSSDEMNKFMELLKQINAGLKGEGIAISDEYVNQYPGVFVITALAIQPDFAKRYKIGHFTDATIGSSHAVFYIDRSVDDVERTKAVLERVKDYKANSAIEDNKQN